MNASNIDGVLWVLGAAGQLVLLSVTIYRRLPRQFPIFFAYIVYSVLSDPIYFVVSRGVSSSTYFKFFFAMSVAESFFQLGILLEIAANVVNRVRTSLPRSALLIFAVMLVSGTLLTFILAGHGRPEDLSTVAQAFVRVNLTFAILRLVIFSAIVLFAQMLGIGWKNHVLQLATGLALYSVMTLLVQMAHGFLGVTDKYEYHVLEQVRVVGWLLALGYWSYAFSRQEAPRKEFSPQMARFLVSISGSAKRDRAVLARLKNE